MSAARDEREEPGYMRSQLEECANRACRIEPDDDGPFFNFEAETKAQAKIDAKHRHKVIPTFEEEYGPFFEDKVKTQVKSTTKVDDRRMVRGGPLLDTSEQPDQTSSPADVDVVPSSLIVRKREPGDDDGPVPREDWRGKPGAKLKRKVWDGKTVLGGLKKLKDHNDQVLLTQKLFVDVIKVLQEAECWPDTGEVIPEEALGRLIGWRRKMEECGLDVDIFECPHGHTATRTWCCHCAPCPREQRSRSARWVNRALLLAEQLKTTPTHRWRFLTLSLKNLGVIDLDVDNTIKLRAKLARHLRKHYGMKAGFITVDVGDGVDNPHLHAAVYCEYLPRAELQTWLRSTDCTVPGCSHPLADDRCDVCKQEKHACTHDDNGRVRCNGSWVIDVREVNRQHGGLRGGLQEVLKYATAPVSSKKQKANDKDFFDDDDKPGVPRKGYAFTDEQLLRAAKLMRLYVVLHKRHRIETYGLARPAQPDEEPGDELDEGTGTPRCRVCGEPMEHVARGTRTDKGKYDWHDVAKGEVMPKARKPSYARYVGKKGG